MVKSKKTKLLLILAICMAVLVSMITFVYVNADSSKGQWGRVTPIADNNHPNLFYNQDEIDELRDMILVQHSPQNLCDLYYNSIRNFTAQPASTSNCPHFDNMKAALSYMIEPTSAKADAIRTALLSYLDVYPDGIRNGWHDTPGVSFSGYSVPFMYDLLMAYNPEKLSSTEKADLVTWFTYSSQPTITQYNNGYMNEEFANATLTREGKSIGGFANWYSRYFGPDLACALMTGNQDYVDYWADSGWPHDLLTADGITSTYPSNTCNVYDMVMYLLAVFPSGANFDTYDREKYDITNHTWETTAWGATVENPRDGGTYHWGQASGAILGAEMAYHNGMTGVFGITDAGTEPALLRTYKFAIQSRMDTDTRSTSLTGHPNVGYEPIIWTGYRRYSDPTIEGALSTLNMNQIFGGEMPNEAWEFFGYPRHVVWTSGATPTPAPTPTPTPGGGGSTLTIQAESYNSMSGISNDTTSIGSCDSGDWTCYNNVNLGSGYTTFTANCAKGNAGPCYAEIRLDSTSGTLVGTLTVNNTGSWSTFQEQTASLSGASGTHNIYIVFQNTGTGNFDWFKFSGGSGSTPTPTPTPTPAAGAWYSKAGFVSGGLHYLGSSNTGTKTVEFDVTPSGTNINGLIGYADTSTTIAGYSDMAMIIRMNDAGSFDVINGSSYYQATNTVNYSSGVKYHVRMVTNLNTGTYSVWVTPNGGSETQIANNYAFRADAPSTNDLGKLQLVAANGYDNSFYVENHAISGSTLTVQAESYNSMSGISNNTTSIGSCDGGDWVCYNNVNLGSGFTTITANCAKGNAGPGYAQIRLDSTSGTLVGTLTVNNTGGWSTYQEQTASLNGASGTHNIYIVFQDTGTGDFDWFRFSN